VKQGTNAKQPAPSGEALPPGLPDMEAYRAVVRSEAFASMEDFSQRFLVANDSALAPYRQKWVADPLHQWSRQWEYPFVYGELARYLGGFRDRPTRVMDAGSGVTFFPFYVAERLGNATVSCVDYDASIARVHAGLRLLGPPAVSFHVSDLHELPFESDHFDGLYCISVLEHTRDYPRIVREFRRVLAPGGLLVVTFDISLDGTADIPPARAEELLRTLATEFPDPGARLGGTSSQLTALLESSSLVTTRSIARIDRHLLPWQPSLVDRLKALLRGRWPRDVAFKNLTVYCCSMRKG
jgi:SAM-dependent methyltransferase